MVNKVNGQKYYEYTKTSQKRREMQETSEFHMDLGKQGVIYEKSEKKQEKTNEVSNESPREGNQKNIQAGATVEISHQGFEKAKQNRQLQEISQKIRKFAAAAVDFLKVLWDKVWNDPSDTKEEEFPVVLAERIEEEEEKNSAQGLYDLEGKDMLTWSIYSQEEIRAIFRRGNQREIEDFLSNHGERHLAKNSDLLTQYDRKGSIVGINRSDKELILHGDKNQIKL